MIGKTFFRLQFQSMLNITLLYTYITVEKLQCVKMYFHSGKAVARLSCNTEDQNPSRNRPKLDEV